MARYKNNPDYFVSKLSSWNTHTCVVLKRMRGFSSLKKGDAFDFSSEGFWDTLGLGGTWLALEDYNKKGDYIEAERMYDPEI